MKEELAELSSIFRSIIGINQMYLSSPVGIALKQAKAYEKLKIKARQGLKIAQKLEQNV